MSQSRKGTGRMLAAIAAFMTLSIVLSCSSDNGHYYVSVKGNDSARGSRIAPLRSPEAAAAKAAAWLQANPGSSSVITLKAGEYVLRDSLSFVKLPGQIILEGMAGDDVVIAGDIDVTGWSASDTPGIWKTNLHDCGLDDLGEVSGMTNRIDFYYAGKRQQIARWPDSGFTKAGLAIGQTSVGDTWIHVHGTREGVFEYVDERIDRWAREDDPYMFGYWYWDWSDQIQRPASIDTDKKVITMEEPYHNYGYRDSLRFYGMNLLCELDVVGEYYIDRKNGDLYWMAPQDFDSSDPQTRVSAFNRLQMVQVDSMDCFVMRNLHFRGTRNGVISIEGGKDNLISGCSFTQIGGVVATIVKGYGHVVDGCHMEELGCGGIKAYGGERETLESSGFRVTNNVVENFSLFKRTYQPAVAFSGVGMYIGHNRFQGSSSSALNIAGNEVTIEYNQCWDLVKESDDQGGFDMYFDYSYRRTRFRHNHWKNIRGGLYAGAAGIRFDDIISGHEVYGDVFEACGDGKFGGVQINGGKDNKIENCVFYDCPRAVSIDAWERKTWDEKLAKNMGRIQNVNAFGELYTSRYPELAEPVNENLNRNYFSDNLVIGAKELFRNGVTNDNCCPFMVESGTVMVDSDIKSLSYYLQPEVLRGYGMKPIPFEQIGPGKGVSSE